MPWEVSTVEKQREELVKLALKEGSNIRELSRRFGVSPSTTYKWIERASEGFGDHSRRPAQSPSKTSPEMEALLLGVRKKHATWGGRKIRGYLLKKGHTGIPSPSTITEVLRRHDKLGPRGGQPRDWKRFERDEPNSLLQMDFKGDFELYDGRRCYPLTLLDDHSRYSMVIKACERQHRGVVQPLLEDAFRTYGMPQTILCDNGAPWGTSADHNLTPLAVWLLRIGIEVIHIKPGHPQTQGKLERFHRTLKADVLQGKVFRDFEECQREFDEFRHCYNHLRPHDSLNLDVPSSFYYPSPRSFPERPLEPEYDLGDIVRKVQKGGFIHFKGQVYSAPDCLTGQCVALRATQEAGKYELRYFGAIIAQVNLRYNRSV